MLLGESCHLPREQAHRVGDAWRVAGGQVVQRADQRAVGATVSQRRLHRVRRHQRERARLGDSKGKPLQQLHAAGAGVPLNLNPQIGAGLAQVPYLISGADGGLGRRQLP